MKHFVCESCGNLVSTVNYTGNRLVCCKEKMRELVPSMIEEKKEKHTPTMTCKRGKVTVRVGGEGGHPMEEGHAIDWICLVTNEGSHRRLLRDKKESETKFVLDDGEKPIAAFAYCNLHGLWVTECVEE